MKLKFLFLPLLALLTSSCSSVYHYYQVYDVKPVDNDLYQTDGLVFEDDYCKVTYSFWSEGGNVSFTIYNKSNDILNIDLARSFYIKNGQAFDYFKNRSWTATRSHSIVSSNSTNNAQSLSGNALALESSSLSNAHYANANSELKAPLELVEIESPCMIIPPHAYKVISEYSILSAIYKDCDLVLYPEVSSSMSFSPDNSPLVFGNDITYYVGEGSETHKIVNYFYIQSITNYAQPNIVTYVERDKPCENVRNPNLYYNQKVYDKYCVVGGDEKFYNYYSVVTNKRLYNFKRVPYVYSDFWRGWVIQQ